MLFCARGYAEGPLIVSYGVTHLNGISDAVSGVLVSPSGEILRTDPMGPFDHCNIVIDQVEVGSYQVYFEVLSLGAFHLCPIVGRVVAILCDKPEKPLAFSPKSARIQTFRAGKKIEIGSTSKPVGSFEILATDLE